MFTFDINGAFSLGIFTGWPKTVPAARNRERAVHSWLSLFTYMGVLSTVEPVKIPDENVPFKIFMEMISTCRICVSYISYCIMD